MRISFLMAGVFFSLAVQAGGVVVGDGGHSIECMEKGLFGKFPRGYLLDMAEALNITKDKPDLEEPYPGTTYTFEPHLYQYLDDLTKHAYAVIGRSHPFSAVLRQTRSVYENVAFFSSDQFELAGDLGPIFTEIPKDCVLKQIGVRVLENGVEQIMFNEVGYQALSWRDRALLVIHETLHSWFQDQGNSLPVRQAMWYLTANRKFREKNQEAFLRLVNEKKPQEFIP